MKTLKEILLLPLVGRCQSVEAFFELASLKDLHDSFPLLISSIFGGDGGQGWRIRFITSEKAPAEFEALYNFFNPLSGPFFRMLYRLTGESLKYVVPFRDLTKKLQESLLSGTFHEFYKKMIYKDPFQNRIYGLQMSPFHYFLFYFALHGTIQYNQMLPSSMPWAPETENRLEKSLYIGLASLYICSFLPTDTQYFVLPQNMQMLLRTMPEIARVKSPTRKIKYLLKHRLDLTATNEQSDTLQPQSARIVHWRSTSMVHIFLDVWLGIDVEPARCLPSVELIRCVRVLVKHLHAFSNCTDMRDSAAFVNLRKTSREKLCKRFTEFFNAVIVRWPLYDGTLIDVVELWLSYIQPWRYQPNKSLPESATLETKFEVFIMYNMEMYTQTFIKLMRRLLETDLLRSANANVLYRPCRVFAQHNLIKVLRQREQEMLEVHERYTPPPWMANRSFDSVDFQNSHLANIDNQLYQPLFSDETVFEMEILVQEVRRVMAATRKAERDLEQFNYHPWIVRLFNKPPYIAELRETQDVLDRLDYVQALLCLMFELPYLEKDLLVRESVRSDSDDSEVDKQLVSSIDSWMDPAVAPIRPFENPYLVRFFHTVASKLQLMFGAETAALWRYDRVPGMIARQILVAPCTIRRFVRQTDGSKQLVCERLPPRISLRFLASYYVLAMIACSLVLGAVLLGAPSYGFFVLILLVLFGKCIAVVEKLRPKFPTLINQ